MNAAIINDITYCKACTPVTVATTANVADGVIALTATQTYYRKATVLGCKSADGTKNTGDVKVGFTGAAGKQPFTLGSGDERTFECALGAKWDLRDLYFSVANDGDGIVVVYH